MRRYHHIGLPANIQQPGEIYLDRFDIHCTDDESNPYGIQWMRYGPKCTLPELVKTVAHIAFEVDDLETEMAGHEVLIAPNNPSEGVMVAFIKESGAPVELLQFIGKRGRISGQKRHQSPDGKGVIEPGNRARGRRGRP